MQFTKPEPGCPVLIEIDGSLHAIRFTLRTLKALKNEHKIEWLKGDPDTFTDPDKLAIMLYYGLRGANPDITQDWVDDNVDSAMILDMAPALIYATTGKASDAQPSPNAEGPKVPQVGSTSGPSAGMISS